MIVLTWRIVLVKVRETLLNGESPFLFSVLVSLQTPLPDTNHQNQQTAG